MAQTYNLDQMIITSTATNFEKNLKNELVIGKAAKAEMKSGLKIGDEVNIIMPAETSFQKWDGGDLNEPEKIKSSLVKVPVDQGYQVNFELEASKALQIEEAGNSDKAAKLVAEYSDNAMYQAKNKVDSYLGSLYPLAGTKETNSGAAIALTSASAENCFKILANVKAKMSRLNAWESGRMLAFLPPEIIAIMLGMPFVQYTESQVKDKAIGEISKKAGFKIFESNNVGSTESGGTITYYPLFAVEGKTFAAPIQKSLQLIPYMRDESLNKAYKGGFVFGGTVPNAKRLATAMVTCTISNYS